ncbi:MAG: hypothetical protein AAF572_10245 [Cyanobacteria bacterium P01_B01_bin.77]
MDLSENRMQSRRRNRRQKVWQTVGLIAIALFTFHAVSSLVFSVVDLAPSSPLWGLTLTLAGFLAVAGVAVGLQSLKLLPQWLTGLVSGAASGALLCFYSFGQLTGREVSWAVAGAVVGLLAGGSLGVWAARKQGFWQVAIALTSLLCAYGFAFGLGTWTLAAVTVERWLLAAGLGSVTFLYLWFTQQALGWAYAQWRRL